MTNKRKTVRGLGTERLEGIAHVSICNVIRRFGLASILLLATILFVGYLTPIAQFWQLLKQGQPLWLGLAFLLQVSWQLTQIAQFRATHSALNLQLPWRQIAPVVLANNFVLVAAPSGSASTFALFLENAQRHKLPASHVSLAVILFAISQYLAHSVTLVTALALLAQQQALYLAELIPASLLFGFTLIMSGLFVTSLKSLTLLEKLIIPPARYLNRLCQRTLMPEPAIHRFISEAQSGLTLFRQQSPRKQWLPFALALSKEGCALLLLNTIFIALQQPPTISALIVGVSMSSLFSIISPTPLGLGVAEGATALVLSTLNIPLESALLICLTYRGFTVWLPMLYGYIALQAIGLQIFRRPPTASS